MNPDDIDFNKLPEEHLKMFKTSYIAYKQGCSDVLTLLNESNAIIIKKTIELYDEKLEEIDKILNTKKD